MLDSWSGLLGQNSMEPNLILMDLDQDTHFSPIPNPKTGSIPVLSWTANFGHLEVVCIPMNDLIFRYSQMLGRIYRYWSPVSFFFPVLRLLFAHDSKVFVLHGLLVLIDSFSFLQEMYTQVGPQFRDELQRHHLPTYLVII